MPNELLWFAFMTLDLTMVLVLFRFFGKTGLYAIIVFNLILCNIQVLKTVELFGFVTTLGNILYASIFLATDLLGEFYGKKSARKGVLLGFITLLLAVAYMQIAIRFAPAPGDFAQPLFEGIFGLLPRLAAASLAAYLLSQMHDVWAYEFWKKKTEGRHLWLRNNASTVVSQAIDTVVFCSIAFIGVFPAGVWFEITCTTYLFKLVVALADTPFIYLAKRLFPAVAATDAAESPRPAAAPEAEQA
ncbi:MAG: queuosine precursor transporter [Desulfovibrionaceae bacterium]